MDKRRSLIQSLLAIICNSEHHRMTQTLTHLMAGTAVGLGLAILAIMMAAQPVKSSPVYTQPVYGHCTVIGCGRAVL